MKRYLVTGFEAFDGQDINPTQELVEALQDHPEFQNNFEIKILPVSFKNSFAKICELHLESFDGIIMTGLASTRNQICFERVALNWIEKSIADNDGSVPKSGPILETAREPQSLFTSAPIDRWMEVMEKDSPGIQTVSLSAGGFVCNYLYYLVANRLKNTKTWPIFIHFPSMDPMVAGHISLSRQQHWLETFLKNVVNDERHFRRK